MDNLVYEIYNYKDFNLNNSLSKRIIENFKKYRNIPIEEIDPKHSWVRCSFDYFLDGNKYFLVKNKLKALYLTKYICVETNDIGFTYHFKNKYIIKPFAVINHDWRRITMEDSVSDEKIVLMQRYSQNIIFTCKKCNIFGVKNLNKSKNKEITPITNNILLSCNEQIISNIIL